MVALSHLVWLLAGGGCGRGTLEFGQKERILRLETLQTYDQSDAYTKTQKQDCYDIFPLQLAVQVNKQNKTHLEISVSLNR